MAWNDTLWNQLTGTRAENNPATAGLPVAAGNWNDQLWNQWWGIPGSQNPATSQAIAGSGDFGTSVSDADVKEAMLRFDEGLKNLPPDVRAIYRNQLLGAKTGEEFYGVLNQAFSDDAQFGQIGSLNSQLQSAERERQGNIDSALGDIEGLRAQFEPMYQERIARYGGILNDPNKLRSDSEFATQLAQTENLINNQVQQSNRQQSLRNADAGVRASGKTGNNILGAQIQGAALKSQNIGNILGGLRTAKEGTETNYQNFLSGLTDAKSQAKQTGFANLLPLQQLGQSMNTAQPDFTTGPLTGLDIKGLNLGQQNYNTGNVLQLLGLLSGATEKGFQGLSQIPPFRTFTNYHN